MRRPKRPLAHRGKISLVAVEQAREKRRDLEACIGQEDSGLKEFRPTERLGAKAGIELPHACDRAWDARRRNATQRRNGLDAGQVGFPGSRLRSRLAEVQRRRLTSAGMDHGKTSTSKVARTGQNHRQGKVRGYGRVVGVSALLENLSSHLGGQRMRRCNCRGMHGWAALRLFESGQGLTLRGERRQAHQRH